MTSSAVFPISRWKLALLLFIQASASGMHTVPLTNVMEAHGMGWAPSFIFTSAAVASMISPLTIGAMADFRFRPERLLAVVLALTAASMGLMYAAVDFHWLRPIFILCVAAFALSVAPAWGLLTAICMANLEKPNTQFPPLRVMATLGWMVSLICVSYLLAADASPRAGYAAAILFGVEAIICATLPLANRPATQEKRPLSDLLGLRALGLLKHPDHRMIFLTTALFSIPLAAFYPYTGPHLRDLGVAKPSAVIALAQVSEILAMLSLPFIIRKVRMKLILATGLVLGVLRYGIYAMDTLGFVVTGLCFHGIIYTSFFLTALLYLEERVSTEFRAQAQALLSIMATGVGSLIGYSLSGVWYAWCHEAGTMNWGLFWSVQTMATAAVTLFFWFGYRGKSSGNFLKPSAPTC